jgi:hypothetical protein
MLAPLRRSAPLAALALASLIALLTACGARVDGSAAGNCPAPTPGLCAPSIDCPADGHRRTGQASCVEAQWVCAEELCADAGPDAASDAGSCNGAFIAQCNAGRVGGFCCPPGAPCAAPQPFCDLGGGACVDGDCTADGGCLKGSLAARDYDQACNVDADCTGVYEGTICSMCRCPNAAIAASAHAAYLADYAAKTPGPSTCACATNAARCDAGRCTLP